MPATPAWPLQSAPRLFVEVPLAQDQDVQIDGAQAHYLIAVMRIKTGQSVCLFDDISGEWRAEAISVSRREVRLRLMEPLRPREHVPDLWLAAAPIRKARYDWVAEKACELGVARFIPVLTRRCVVDKVKPDRLRAHMIEAAEQCSRTTVPQIGQPAPLASFLSSLCGERSLFFADETGGAPAAGAISARRGPAAILIGPEGGFAPEEREAIRAHPNAVAISLGPRILRADSAAVAATAVWMSVAGDWAEAK